MSTEPLVLGDLTAQYWAGNELNAPDVRLEIDTHRTIYDRDYSTEEKITGWQDLSLEEVRQLHAFLGGVLGEDDYEYNIRREGAVPLYTAWGDKALIEKLLGQMQTGVLEDLYRLVRRRKAGPVEDVDA